VRPRIAPAFAQLAESAERAPAGDALRGAPEAPRAIAPLPLEGQRTANPHGRTETRHETTAVLPRRETLQRPQPTDFCRASKDRDVDVSAEPVRPKEKIVLAENDVSSTATAREEMRPMTVRPLEQEPALTPTLEAVAIKRETSEELKIIAKAAEPTISAPSVFPTIRPVIAKAEMPLEAPKKKPVSEPAIQVTIGKIEVRASIAAPKSGEKKMPTGAMSLEEYQRMRSRRSAG
jgi:hypothetical protein